MSLSDSLLERSQSTCELCTSPEGLSAYVVPPKSDDHDDHTAVTCKKCLDQIEQRSDMEANHWRCLNESIWSEVPAVKVLAYRILESLKTEDWASDLQGMMYLEEDQLEWAQNNANQSLIHKDANGNILEAGDSVTLIQDLNVKGANFTAKRGTAVRRIRLVHDNAEHIEGKVDGQQIVILTKYVKKS